MKVLHGMLEAAGQAGASVTGLKLLGVDAKLAVYESNEFSSFTPDYVLGADKVELFRHPWRASSHVRFAAYASKAFDTFHFHFGTSLLPKNLDLAQLQAKRAGIFLEYHGSDIRQGPAFYEGNPYASLLPRYETSTAILRKATRQVAFATGVIVHDAELVRYLPPNSPTPYIVPLRVDLTEINRAMHHAQKLAEHEAAITAPCILHAPSDRPTKGTDIILQHLSDLSSQYDFSLELREGAPHQEVLNACAYADIIVDQILMGTYGVLAIEAMAMGKPVICYIREDLVDTYPQDLPIVSATPDDFQEKVRILLDDPELRHDLGQRGKEYVAKYHDHRVIAHLLRDIYEHKTSPLEVHDAFDLVKTLSQS